MKRQGLLLAGVSFIVLSLSAVIWMQWGGWDATVLFKNTSHEMGYAYTAELNIPERKISLGVGELIMRYKMARGDSVNASHLSSLSVFEDGRPLGPAHSLHEHIRNIGKGSYSHWENALYFSSSDNTDPRTNGRVYTAKGRLVMKGGVKKALNVLVILGVVGLLLSFYSFFARIFMSLCVMGPLWGIGLWLAVTVMFLRWNRVPIGFSLVGILLHGLLILAVLFSFALTLFLIFRISKTKQAIVWLVRIVGWGLCVFQLILVLEVLCRVVPLPDTLAINPGVRHFWADWIYHPLNSAGYREKDFSEKKQGGVYRVFVVGDSYIEGAGLRRDQTAGSFLEREVNRRLERAGMERRVEVYNLGHCGDNAVQEFARMKEMVPRFHPDLVVMTYVLNDAEEQGISLVDSKTSRLRAFLNTRLTGVDGSYLWYRYLDIERTWISRMRPATRFTNYTEDIHRADASGWIATQKAFVEMRTYFKEQGIDWFYVIFPLFSSGAVQESTKTLHSKIRDAMVQKGVEAYDLLPFYLSREPDLGRLAFSHRDSHPNARAQMLLGEFLSDNIVKRSTFKAFLEKTVVVNN